MRLRGVLAPLLLSSFLVAAAPAAAATVTDATGDATTADAGHDITQVEFNYDPAGAVAGTITVAGATATDAGLLLSFSVANADGSCSQTDGAYLVGVKSVPTAAQWTLVTAGKAGAFQAAQRSGSDQAFTIAASDPQLAGKGYNCVEAQTTAPDNTDVVYDSASGVATAAPTPTPGPSPTPAPTTTPAPAKQAKLRASFSKVPSRVRRGQTFRPRLTIRNRGTAASKAVTVKVKSARGLSVSPRTIKLKALAPNKAKTVTLRVKLGSKARSSTPLALTGGGLSARKALLLRKPQPQPKPKPTPSKGGLPGTLWWWNDYSFEQPFDIYALRFFDNGYAYYRLPDEKQSVPDKCTSVTAKPDEDGEWGPGCVKWTLKDGKVTISDPRFQLTYAGGKLAVRDAEDTFKVDGLAAPKPGQRFNVSYNNIETSGLCGAPGAFCSVQKSFLTLQSDGRFGLQEENTSSLDIPGVSFTGVNSFPPENRGTYEVLSGFRVRLSYDDGSEAVVPFGLVNGTSSVDSNVKLVLGRLAFWPKDEDD